MAAQCALGIDIGTTSMKIVIIDDSGHIRAHNSLPQTLISRFPGWAEEDPKEWWTNTVHLIRRCMSDNGISGADIKGVGVSGMVPALVVLDRDGIPLRFSIQQNDARTAVEIEQMKELINNDYFYTTTGGAITQQSIGPKLLWLKKHEPEVIANAHTILGSYDYINFKLTGALSVEKNWALESGLYDLAREKWDSYIVESIGINPDVLPPIKSPHEIVGTITSEAAELTGLLPGTPVVAGCADHVSSTFAAGIVHEGEVNIKFGGAGDILYCMNRLRTDPRLFIDYHLVPGKFLLNGCMASSGSLVKWFVEEFCQKDKEIAQQLGKSIYSYLDEKACSISSDAVILPYFIGEKTPIFDPIARGVFFGLGLHHKKEHIYRSILESVVFGFKHHLDVIREMGCNPTRVVATDGGSRSALWRQISTDILGLPVMSLTNYIGSSLGAAFVAGLATNIYSKWEDINIFIKIAEINEPNMQESEIYNKKYKIYRNIYQVLKEDFEHLHNISLS